MIKTKRGSLSHIVISTILGHGGFGMFPYFFFPTFWYFLFTIWRNNISIFAKSATRHRHCGNFIWWNPWTWRFVHVIKNKESLLNAYGLTNPGVVICAIMIRIACMLGFKVIPSYFIDFSRGYITGLREAEQAICIYKKILGKYFWAIELNPSCPNHKEPILTNQGNILAALRALKQKFPWLHFIIKGSIVYPGEFYSQAEQAGADTTHVINTISFDVAVGMGISPYEKSPLGEKTKGGFSGKIITDAACKYSTGTVIPATTGSLIFGGGISEWRDTLPYQQKLRSRGDRRNFSFSICTAAKFNFIEAARFAKNFHPIEY
ncbi:MAG: hypothetical protein WC120_02605 [Parcubacteria group bacterium]